jgi:DNA invertase Pin-like site-specific DNA recombinase
LQQLGFSMLVGYARVSTDDQDLTLQRTALKDAGCKRVYEEKVSGVQRSRPELTRMLDQLRAGDVVVVSRLDRLARSTRDLLNIAEQLKEVEAGLRSLHEPWADTTSPAGRMVLTVFAGIAEFEHELIRERTSSGRVSAKARGVRFGRPPKLTGDRIALARRLIAEGISVPEVSKILNVHRTTLYRVLEI